MKALVDRLKDGPATTSELSRITGWTNTELWSRLSCFEDQGRVKHRTRGRGRGSSTTWWLASTRQAPQPPESAIIYLGAVIIALAALSLGVVLRNGVIDALEGTLIEGADGAGVS